jgi:hypothetical protein
MKRENSPRSNPGAIRGTAGAESGRASVDFLIPVNLCQFYPAGLTSGRPARAVLPLLKDRAEILPLLFALYALLYIVCHIVTFMI